MFSDIIGLNQLSTWMSSTKPQGNTEDNKLPPEEIGINQQRQEEGESGDSLRVMQDKIAEGFKAVKSFLCFAVGKAEKAANEASTKIKEAVSKTTTSPSVEPEAEATLKKTKEVKVILPWEFAQNQDELRDKCLSLSSEKKNFLRDPPLASDFEFDKEKSYPLAVEMMKEDRKLEMMRYELVPKEISEENFWRNYFYRIRLVCKAHELVNARYNLKPEKAEVDITLTELENDLGDELEDYEVFYESTIDNESWQQELSDLEKSLL